MTEPEIHDALHRIIPDNLDAHGLAAGALRKRRNRTRAVAGGAALALVALAVPLALTLSNVNRPVTATPAEQSTGVETSPPALTPSGIPEACAQDWSALPTSNDLGALPSGATRAWLCGDAGMLPMGGHVGPLEPLTSDVDKVVDAFKALTVGHPEVTMCTEEYTLTYRVVLEYAGGKQRVVSGDLHGCRFVNDGSGDFREGGPAYLSQLITMWQAQRTASGQDVAGDVVGCPGSAPIMPMSVADAVRGSACSNLTSSTGEPVSGAAAPLPPELLALVKAGLADAPTSAASTADQTDFALSLVNRFGDTRTFRLGADGAFTFFDGQVCLENNPASCSETYRTWKPSPEVMAQLKALLADVPMTPVSPSPNPSEGQTSPGDPGTGATEPADPGSTTPPLQPIAEPAGCAGAVDGTLASTTLPGGKLPDGPQRVWLCPKGFSADVAATQVGPWEPLTTDSRVTPAGARNVTLAADSLNALPPQDPNAVCTLELGTTYLVVYEYADGKRYVVEVQPYGCGTVIAGEQQLAGAGQFLDGLVKLWASQRAQVPAKVERPGRLCSLSSLMQPSLVDPKLASATACSAVDGVTRETALAPDVVAQIAAGIGAREPMSEGRPGYTDQTLVLVNEAGDPISLQRLIDGSFTWMEAEQNLVWEPTGKLADELKVAFGS